MLIAIHVVNVLLVILSMLPLDYAIRFVGMLKGLLFNVMMAIILMVMAALMIVSWSLGILAMEEVQAPKILAPVVYPRMLISYKLDSHICMGQLS